MYKFEINNTNITKKEKVKIMERHLDCFFCKEIEDPTQNILRKSRIIYETANFLVFPTVGCFQIGYLLVMPKVHYLCFGELSSDLIDELNEIINRLSDFIQRKEDKKCIIFEHGTRDLSKLTSTSIMHAHIHIMPFDKNVVDYLSPECQLKKIEGFGDLKKESDNYLFLRNITGINYIVTNNKYPSQFFRKVLCEIIGKPSCWNWRKNPYKRNMNATIEYYSGL